MGLTTAVNMVPFAAILACTLDVGIAHFILAKFQLTYYIISVYVSLLMSVYTISVYIIPVYNFT